LLRELKKKGTPDTKSYPTRKSPSKKREGQGEESGIDLKRP